MATRAALVSATVGTGEPRNLTIGSLPVMQGLKLQQMTLLVIGLLAVAMALLAADYPIAAGIVLALATIKPQLVWLLLFWLMIWTLADWRHRYRWAASFLLTMAILFAVSEWYLPHWISRFLQAVREYRNYAHAVSVLDKLVPARWEWLLRMIAPPLRRISVGRTGGWRKTLPRLPPRFLLRWP